MTSVVHTDLERAQEQILDLQDANERSVTENMHLRNENTRLKAALIRTELEWEKYRQAHP